MTMVQFVENHKTTNRVSDVDLIQNSDTGKYEFMYFMVIALLYSHLAGLYGLYLCFTSAFKGTILFNVLLLIISAHAIVIGSHRLWSHRSYKATKPLQILLMLLISMAAQFTIEKWVLVHRLHHKYADTDADPHNSRRGLFFTHIGWLLIKKHKDVSEKVKTIDMSDIRSNPVLMFQKKYAHYLFSSLCIILPTVTPMYFWSETFTNAYHIAILRFCLGLHLVFIGNSLGHSSWGYRPYDEKVKATQSFILNICTCGEGNHNFHHVFPSDYRSTEMELVSFNSAISLIHFFAWIGWAYDLKTVDVKIIKERSKRSGDGSRVTNHETSIQEVSFLAPLTDVELVHAYGGEAKIGQFKHHVFIYQLYNERRRLYRAFCAGSIITEERVLTSSHCFLTNRKRRKRNFKNIRVVAGVLETLIPKLVHNTQQWRKIKKLYSQRFFRFPAYNLAILVVDEKWDFNLYVNKIPYAIWDQDFDGVCYGTTVKSTTSWSSNKNLFIISFRLLKRLTCEHKLLRSCIQFYCTEYDTMTASSIEIEGGGLICFGTNDPREDAITGVLVGVTSLINVDLPSLHNRVGLYHRWVADDGVSSKSNILYLIFIILCNLI